MRFLLMGGQACVLYGAAEFSRDADILIFTAPANLLRLRKALAQLDAEPIAVPGLSASVLRRGHAVHFRCRHPEAAGLRVDIMAVLRGLPPFSTMWRRRTTLVHPGGLTIDILGLPDLVRAKKTQRDKDWPMVRRLVEADFLRHPRSPATPRVSFWLRELRTPELLARVARRHPAAVRRLAGARPLLRLALAGHVEALAVALKAEEEAERVRDQAYWTPLRRELETLRRREVRRRRAARRPPPDL